MQCGGGDGVDTVAAVCCAVLECMSHFLCVQASTKNKAANPMREIFVEKLILNISVGESGDRLTFAARVLNQLVRLSCCCCCYRS